MPGVTYLTAQLAAKHLGVATSTLRKLTAADRLVPAWRTAGGHARYTIDGLDRFKRAMYPRSGGSGLID